MQVNQRVAGNYIGHSFAGRITEQRALTVKTDGCMEYMIDLERPIVVFGTQRDRLCVYARFDGSPSSYTKFTDWLRAA